MYHIIYICWMLQFNHNLVAYKKLFIFLFIYFNDTGPVQSSLWSEQRERWENCFFSLCECKEYIHMQNTKKGITQNLKKYCLGVWFFLYYQDHFSFITTILKKIKYWSCWQFYNILMNNICSHRGSNTLLQGDSHLRSAELPNLPDGWPTKLCDWQPSQFISLLIWQHLGKCTKKGVFLPMNFKQIAKFVGFVCCCYCLFSISTYWFTTRTFFPHQPTDRSLYLYYQQWECPFRSVWASFYTSFIHLLESVCTRQAPPCSSSGDVSLLLLLFSSCVHLAALGHHQTSLPTTSWLDLYSWKAPFQVAMMTGKISSITTQCKKFFLTIQLWPLLLLVMVVMVMAAMAVMMSMVSRVLPRPPHLHEGLLLVCVCVCVCVSPHLI